MKSLEEKKLLVKMARMLGQPVDQALVESIEREERLSKILFKEENSEKPKIVGYEEGTTFLNRKPIFEEQLIVEAEPSQPEPAPAFTPPMSNTVQAVMNVLATRWFHHEERKRMGTAGVCLSCEPYDVVKLSSLF